MRLTLRAGVDLGLLVLRLVERPDDVAALDTVVLDHAELGQDPAAATHHSAGLDQLVEMELPQAPDETSINNGASRPLAASAFSCSTSLSEMTSSSSRN